LVELKKSPEVAATLIPASAALATEVDVRTPAATANATNDPNQR
jgi:hypothetical protein